MPLLTSLHRTVKCEGVALFDVAMERRGGSDRQLLRMTLAFLAWLACGSLQIAPPTSEAENEVYHSIPPKARPRHTIPSG